MQGDKDRRGFAALRAYVEGDSSVVMVMSDLKEYRPEEINRLLKQHRTELESIDPARHVILESILPRKR